MFCKKCGKYVQPNEKVCPYCGEEIIKNTEDVSNQKEDFGETKIFGNLDIDDSNGPEELAEIPDEIEYVEDEEFDFPEDMEDEEFQFEDEDEIDEDEEYYNDDEEEEGQIDASKITNQNKKMNIIAIAVSAGIIIIIVIAAVVLSKSFSKPTEETTTEEQTTKKVTESVTEDETEPVYVTDEPQTQLPQTQAPETQ